jgi:GNAT superfamily N-acetyltransferase
MSTTCRSNNPSGDAAGDVADGIAIQSVASVYPDGVEIPPVSPIPPDDVDISPVSPDGVAVSPISPADHVVLLALIREFAEFERSPDKMTNSIERMAAESDWLTGFVAKTPSGEVVGYATFFFAYYSWTGKSLWMDDLYVSPGYRGRGLGRRLIDAVIRHARLAGCHKMRWQVSSWNTHAIGFYRSLGARLDDIQLDCHLSLR